jgi:hypothetical protein
MRRQWFEVAWLVLLINVAAILLTRFFISSESTGPSKAVVAFFVGALCGSSASLVERNLWNIKFFSNLVLRPTRDLSFALLTRLDRAASALERADNDAWQCQSGYWNLGIDPGTARNRMRLIFEGSKERLVTRWGRSDIYFMDARWQVTISFFSFASMAGDSFGECFSSRRPLSDCGRIGQARLHAKWLANLRTEVLGIKKVTKSAGTTILGR